MKLDESQTFSEQVKNEICFNVKNSFELELIIFSYLKNIAEYNLGGECVECKTPYICIVKLFKQLCSINSHYTLEVGVGKQDSFKNNKKNYLIRLFANDINELQAKIQLSELDLDNSNIAKSILIGGFLSGGSVSNPGKSSYHLEIRTCSEQYKNILINILSKFNLVGKTVFHHNKWVIYFKKSSEISDLLKIIQAQNAMFFLEDNRIERDMVNNLQRLVNLEVFNLNKTTKAGIEQSKMCQIIQTSVYYQSLNAREKLYCEIRANNPEPSMQGICKLMNKRLPENKNISKGSLSHIVKKIRDIYNKI